MLCECGEREATIHEVVIRNGAKYERHLCEACAAAQGFDAGDGQSPSGSLLEHLSSIFGAAGFTESASGSGLLDDDDDLDDDDVVSADEDDDGDDVGGYPDKPGGMLAGHGDLSEPFETLGSPAGSSAQHAGSSSSEDPADAADRPAGSTTAPNSDAQDGASETSSTPGSESVSTGAQGTGGELSGGGLSEATSSGGVRRGPPRVCRGCGASFDDFRRSGLLGCAVCYEVYATLLSPIIERAQNRGSHHVGKVPRHALERSRAAGSSASVLGNDEERLERLGLLRRQLADAINQEEYERAAHIRDELQRLNILGSPGGELSDTEPDGAL